MLALPKCYLMASSAQVRAQLPKWARDADDDAAVFKVPIAARDLGHDTSMGACRSVKVRRLRLNKGRRAALRIYGLVRTSHKASKLFATNKFPKSAWAPEVQGLPPTMI